MNSPPEISPGWIVLRLRLDPAVLDFRRAEAQPASAPCRMNTKSRIHISLTRIIHQRRKKRLTEPGFTTKDAVTGCWEVCSAEIGRWEVKNGVFGTQHSRRQLRNRVFGPSWAAKWGEVCPRRARRSLAQGMRS